MAETEDPDPGDPGGRLVNTLGRMSQDLMAAGFGLHLEGDDLLGVLLRAHMLVERELTYIVEHALPHPELLKARWSFRHRLELVAALGRLHQDDVNAYRYLDELRNRVAHRLNYQISEVDQIALIRRMVPRYKHSALLKEQSESFPAPLRHALKLLVMHVAIRRHGLDPPE